MDMQSTTETMRGDRGSMLNDTESMLNDREPIYENFMCVDNVSIFDHRVIGAMKSVNNALNEYVKRQNVFSMKSTT